MVPESSELGDSIAMLEEGSVFFVLRPCEGGYRYVGECYVHGLMDGEVLDWEDLPAKQEIWIVEHVSLAQDNLGKHN